MPIRAPKAPQKIKELYAQGLSQDQIAEQLNALNKTDPEGYGNLKWRQETVSSYSRRAGLKPAHPSRRPPKKTVKRKYTKRAKPAFIDVPMHQEGPELLAVAPSTNGGWNNPVYVVFGTPEQVTKMLRELNK